MPEIRSQQEALSLVREGLVTRESRIAQLLPEGGMSVKQFNQIGFTLIERTPQFLACTPQSLVGSIIECAKLGLTLDPILGQAYLVPYRDSRANVTRAVLIPGYRGLMTLALRSAQVDAVWAEVVRVGDLIEQRQGTVLELVHKQPPLEDRTVEYLKDPNMIGAYSCAQLTNGMVLHTLMSTAEIEAIRSRSPGKSSGPWVTNRAEMYRKTPVRRLCKYLPLSPTDMRAVVKDEYFDAGIEPEPTEVEFEESDGGTTQVVVPELAQVAGPIRPATLRDLNAAFGFHKMDPEEIEAACEKAGGVTRAGDLTDDDAQRLLRNLREVSHEILQEQLDDRSQAQTLFPDA